MTPSAVETPETKREEAEAQAKQEMNKAQTAVPADEAKAALAKAMEEGILDGDWFFSLTLLKVDLARGGGGREVSER